MNHRVLRTPVWLACLFSVVLAGFQVSAQTPPSSLTPEQMQIFRNLPPEQQKAVLDAMSKSSPETAGIGEPQTSSAGIEGEQRPAPRKEESKTPPEPRFKPQSTVLLGIEVIDAPENQGRQRIQIPSEEEKALLQQRRERILTGN